MPTCESLFNSSWSTVGPGSREWSFNWVALANEDRAFLEHGPWPILTGLVESDFNALRQSALDMIQLPMVSEMVKHYYSLQHHLFPRSYSPHLFDWLDTLLLSSLSCPSGWTPCETRHRQSALLALAACSAWLFPDLRVHVLGQTRKANVEQFAFKLFKMACVLFQPLDPVRRDDSEFSYSSLVALGCICRAMQTHPVYPAFWKAIPGPKHVQDRLAQSLLPKIRGDLVQIEMFKRMLKEIKVTNISYRFWADMVGEPRMTPASDVFHGE